MKTNRFARGLVRTRVAFLCLAVAGMTALGFWLGDHLPKRPAQPAASQVEIQPPPPVDLSELLAAAR